MNTHGPQTTLDAISRNAFAVVVIGGPPRRAPVSY